MTARHSIYLFMPLFLIMPSFLLGLNLDNGLSIALALSLFPLAGAFGWLMGIPQANFRSFGGIFILISLLWMLAGFFYGLENPYRAQDADSWLAVQLLGLLPAGGALWIHYLTFQAMHKHATGRFFHLVTFLAARFPAT